MLFLGIDGGGSKCRARIRDQAGKVLGEGEGGPANIHQDFEGSVRSILTAAKAARPSGNLGELHAGLGLAGVETLASLRPLQDALPFATMTAINDAPAACLGAHGGADGGIVIAGTGSAGCAIVGGKTTIIGGWGFELGDDGSGAIMGRAVVRAAVRSIDGLGEATPLTKLVLKRLGRDRPTLTAWARAAKTSDYAALAPDVIKYAKKQDPVAADCVQTGMAALISIADALRERGAPRLSMVGGLAAPLLSLRWAYWSFTLEPPLADAVDGAIMVARRAAGLPPVPEGGPS